MRLRVSIPPEWHAKMLPTPEQGFAAEFDLRFRKAGYGKPTANGPTLEVVSKTGKLLSVLNLKINGKGKITPSALNIHADKEVVPEADRVPDNVKAEEPETKSTTSSAKGKEGGKGGGIPTA